MAFELFPVVQWFDNSGNPLSGGLILTYAAGTTTPQATFTDSTGGTPNPNPVALDSAGRAQIWFAAASYKLVLQTSGGVTLMTLDNVTLDNLAATISSLNMSGNLTMQQPTAATSGANQSSNTYSLQGNYWNGTTSAIDQWTFQDVLGTGSNPTSNLTISHSGSSGATALSIPGNETVGGTLGVTGATTLATASATQITNTGDTLLSSGKVIKWNADTGLSRDSAGVIDVGNGTQGDKSGTVNLATLVASKVNSVLWVDGIKYTTLGGAYADLPSTGGIVVVPPNYSETLFANLTLSKPNAGFWFMGPALITMGSNQVVINQALAGPFIVGQVPTGAAALTSGGSISGTGGVTFVYTGTGTAFSIGGASATPLVGLRLENFSLDLSGAGTSAIGMDLLNVHGGGRINAVHIHGIGPTGATQTQKGIQVDDGGGFSGDFTIDTCQFGFLQTGILFNGQSQEITLLGCQFFGGAASSIAIDIESLWGIQSWGGNIDSYVTSVKMGGSASQNYIAMPMGNFTTMVNFGASTTRNTVQTLRNSAPVVSDSGTLNSVIWGGTHGALLNSQDTLTNLTGNGSANTVYTYTIPAGTIQAGAGIRLTMFSKNNSAVAVAYNITLGSTTFGPITSSANSGNTHSFKIEIFNNAGVQNAQVWTSFAVDSATILNNGNFTSAENTANALALKITATQASGTITPEKWFVESIAR